MTISVRYKSDIDDKEPVSWIYLHPLMTIGLILGHIKLDSDLKCFRKKNLYTSLCCFKVFVT